MVSEFEGVIAQGGRPDTIRTLHCSLTLRPDL